MMLATLLVDKECPETSRRELFIVVALRSSTLLLVAQPASQIAITCSKMMNEQQITAKVDQLYYHMFSGMLGPDEEKPHQIIAPYLYLGNIGDAYNIEKLIEKKITNVINAADPSLEGKFKYYIIIQNLL
jgi:hypothetical protein